MHMAGLMDESMRFLDDLIHPKHFSSLPTNVLDDKHHFRALEYHVLMKSAHKLHERNRDLYSKYVSLGERMEKDKRFHEFMAYCSRYGNEHEEQIVTFVLLNREYVDSLGLV